MARAIGLKLFAALASAIIVLPVIAVIPVAFSAHSYARLPPEAWSLRWWAAFFADPTWFAALIVSLEVAVLSAVACIVLGTSAALGMNRLPPVARKLLAGVFLGPIIAPTIVLAVGLYSLARSVGLVGSLLGLVIAHTMLAMPYAVLNIGVSLAALDPRLALAAAGLGADRWRIFRTITLPLILPGIAGGAVFAFVTSFDEVVLAIFLSGPQVKTLPVRIWEEIRVEYTPVVAVAATIMIVLAITGAALGRLLGRVRQEARA
ncbi:MAG: ABC transporter permease [Hyphomicrobiales bacterium]|nr:ABC transporter permease [Hyphomicrobiales bacterium]